MTKLGKVLWMLGAWLELQMETGRRYWHCYAHGTVARTGFRRLRWTCQKDGASGWV